MWRTRIDTVEAELIQMMTDEECTGFDRNGIRFSLVIREYPGAVPEEKEELYRRMRAHGLECLKVGTEEYCPKPNFIPFFRDQKQITIGSKTDISLQIWDVPKGLNQKAAVFHYMAFPNNTGAIRSLKGMRHNRKEIFNVQEEFISEFIQLLRYFLRTIKECYNLCT